MRKKQTKRCDDVTGTRSHSAVRPRRVTKSCGSKKRRIASNNDLAVGYAQMARDDQHEVEALEWAEATCQRFDEL
jgi:hypothetical protein